MKIEYAIQTNGYLIDEEWASFLGQHHFLVGVSLDRSKEVHDRHCEPVTSDSRGRNYFCESYKEFFEYAYTRLVEIYQLMARRG